MASTFDPRDNQVRIYDTDTNFTKLSDFLNKGLVKAKPYTSATVTVSGASFKLIDSTFVSGTIAKGTSTTQRNGSVFTVALAGAVGTASSTAIALDTDNWALNIGGVFDSATQDPIFSGGRIVSALWQTGTGVADGATIGASGSENIQVSFVTRDNLGVYNLVSVTGTFNLEVPVIRANRTSGIIERVPTSNTIEQVPQASQPLERTYIVTTAFTSSEVITVSTGAGGVAGVSTATGDTISSLGASSGVFNANTKLSFIRNGVELKKGTSVSWVSATTFSITSTLLIDEMLVIRLVQ